MSDAGIQSTTSPLLRKECTYVCIHIGRSQYLQKKKLLKIVDEKWTGAWHITTPGWQKLEINNRNSGFGQLKKLLEEKINQ